MVGILVWFGFHESGVHATIAGVILGLVTPAHRHVPTHLLGKIVQQAGEQLSGSEFDQSDARVETLRRMALASREAISPLVRIEDTLHPWVGFVIMPIFALANAGVMIHFSDFVEPVALAIMAGLLIGKPLGIGLFCWLAVRFRLAVLPAGVSWGVIIAGGFLAGIGFTMALFIAGLALDPGVLNQAKVGILGASVLAAVFGMLILFKLLPRTGEDPAND
jgi:NhaA family Na+:H+ antiporter